MTWRFAPGQSPTEPARLTPTLKQALTGGSRRVATRTFLHLSHGQDHARLADLAAHLSTNTNIGDGLQRLATRTARKPTTANITALTDTARSASRAAAVKVRVQTPERKRPAGKHRATPDQFGDTILAGCPTQQDPHRHVRTAAGWLCGDTAKRFDALTDPANPHDR